MAEARRDNDEFYIGYLERAPPGHRRLIAAFACLLVALGVSLSALLAASQADPGPGRYEFGIVTQHRGLLVLDPCPALVQPPAVTPGPARVVLLVGTGKCGALDPPGACGPKPWDGRRGPGDASILHGLNGRPVSIKGSIIERNGRRMIEIADRYDAVQLDVSAASGEPPVGVELHRVSLAGEVVDPKCYLGAMKPARGATHRACAARCLIGGIPPMLAGERGRLTLLVRGDGTPAGTDLAQFAADRVRVDGVLSHVGDLDVLRIERLARD